MDARTVLSACAGILSFVGYAPYVRAILRKKTHPVRASWIIWIAIDVITILTMIAEKSLNGQMIGIMIGGTGTLCLAMKYGRSGWTLADKICLISGCIGIAAWQASGNALWGLGISMAVIFVGSIPTFIAAWEEPTNENRAAWTIWGLSCVCAVLAIPRWDFANAAQPVTFATIQAIMMYLVWIRRAKMEEKPEPCAE